MTASHHLAQRYLDTIARLGLDGQLLATDLHPSIHMSLELNKVAGISKLHLILPTCDLKVRVLGLEDTDVQTEGSLSFILANPVHMEDQRPRSKQQTAFAEALLVVDGLQSICQDAAEKMEFSSLEEVPSKLAETVLEVLDLPSLNITLQEVQLNIRPVSDLRAMYRGIASREVRSNLGANQAQTKPGSTDSILRGSNEATGLPVNVKDALHQTSGCEAPLAFKRTQDCPHMLYSVDRLL